jgi:hypothetical protein
MIDVETFAAESFDLSGRCHERPFLGLRAIAFPKLYFRAVFGALMIDIEAFATKAANVAWGRGCQDNGATNDQK